MPKNEWMPVDENTPIDVNLSCFDKNDGVYIARRYSDCVSDWLKSPNAYRHINIDSDMAEFANPTHWRFLPEYW